MEVNGESSVATMDSHAYTLNLVAAQGSPSVAVTVTSGERASSGKEGQSSEDDRSTHCVSVREPLKA